MSLQNWVAIAGVAVVASYALVQQPSAQTASGGWMIAAGGAHAWVINSDTGQVYKCVTVQNNPVCSKAIGVP